MTGIRPNYIQDWNKAEFSQLDESSDMCVILKQISDKQVEYTFCLKTPHQANFQNIPCQKPLKSPCFPTNQVMRCSQSTLHSLVHKLKTILPLDPK